MNCQQAREKLYDRLFDLLESTEQAALDQHLANCPACARALEQAKRETALLDHWTAPLAPESLVNQTLAAARESATHAAPAEQPAATRRPVSREPVWGWFTWRRYWATVTAVSALVAVVAGAQTVRLALRQADPTEVRVFGQKELTPGQTAAFRVAVTDGRQQQPLADAVVDLELVSSDGRTLSLGNARTDADGVVSASAALPADWPTGHSTVKARAASSAGKSGAELGVTVERSTRVLITTDKPLYQPGQTIHMRTLALATSDMRPAAAQELVLEVQDAKGNKVFKKRLTTSAFGIASADFVLADQVNTGSYTITATMGETVSERGVTVERYVLPKYKIELTPDRGYYQPGQVAMINLLAMYTFGQPVAGATVEVSAEEFIEQFRPFATFKLSTDAEGRCRLEIPLKDFFAGQDLKKGDALARITAKVTDAAGHVQEKRINLTVTSAPIKIELLPESGDLVRNVENTLYVVAVYPDGRPAQAKVRLVDTGQTIETSETGVGTATVTPLEDRFAVTAVAEDRQGLKASVTKSFEVGQRTDGFIVRTDKAVYRSGETAHVEVVSAMPRTRVYLDVVQDGRTWLMQTVAVDKGRGQLSLDLPEDLAGTLELQAYRILSNGEIVRDAKVIQVNRADDLAIRAELDKESYRPGEKALLTFLVTRRDGDPVPAALSLAGVDEAVFALSEMRPGLEKVYFALQAEILKPRYEIHATIAPEQTVDESSLGAAGGQDAARALFSAAQDTGVNSAEGMSYLQKQESNRERWYEHERWLERTLVGVPTMLFGVLVLPVFLYAAIVFIKPVHDLDLSQDKRKETRRSVNRVMAYWIVGIYLPIASLIPCRFLNDRWYWDDYAPLWVVGTALIMLGLLVATVWRARRCDPVRESKLIRGALTWLPVAYAAGWFAALVSIGNRNDEMLVVTVVLAGLIPSLYGVVSSRGILAVSRRGSLARFVGWSMLVLLPAMAVLPAMRPGRDIMAKLGPVDAVLAELAALPSISVWDAKTTDLSKEPSSPSSPRIRHYFPETLFWRPELITDEAGRARLEVDLADSITTWRVAMSAVSAKGELGAGSTGLRVFQDFFVDIDFPVALTQNDVVSVPVAIYNYLDQPQTVHLTAEVDGGWCAFLDGTERQVTIAANQVTATSLRVKAVKPGQHALTVKAIGSALSDAVRREVMVVPDGELVEQTFNGDLRQHVVQEVSIPAEAIDGATDLFVKIYPGAFSQVMEGLDGIFQMPYGCFEQTSSTTYPNVLVLDYLRSTKQIKPDIEMKAAGFINAGYQRLLSYEVDGGGFEWFGKPPAHTILTAYGLMEFHDMAKVHEVDPAVITRTREWLFKQQSADGSWQVMQGGIAEGAINQFQNGNGLRNTAYIAWAIAESDGADDARLGRTLQYMAGKIGTETDAYTLALCANAMASAGRKTEAATILDRLEKTKVTEDKLVHWKSTGEGATYSRGESLEIETTALVAYAMLRADRYVPTAKKALAWLISRKDPRGTWYSTQATVHAMRALLAGTKPGADDNTNLQVTIAVNGQRVEDLAITPETADVFRLVSLRGQVRSGTNQIALETSGTGSLDYQIVARHYRPWPIKPTPLTAPEPLDIAVTYDTATLKQDEILTGRVNLRYHRPGKAMMTIVDLGIPPGFEVVMESFDQLKSSGLIERYSVAARQVILYFREIEQGRPVEFSFRMKAKYPVRAKTPPSTAYQYYEPEIRSHAEPVVLTVE